MKTTLILLALSVLTAGQAQQPSPGAPPIPPPVAPAAPRPVAPPKFEPKFEFDEDMPNETVPRGAGGRAKAGVIVHGGAGGLPGMDNSVELRLQDVRTAVSSSGSVRGSRTLVVQSSDPDPAAIGNAEEDLAIMARILEKAVRTSQDDVHRMAANIIIEGGVFSSSSGARNIYLEGYGALFLLGVKYPLIAPPNKPVEAKSKDTASDDWREAREEIQNIGRGGGDALVEMYTTGIPRGPAEEYDADRVEKLKDSILGAFKNVVHIRALKPSEFVTVVVQGSEAARTEVTKLSGNPKEKEGGRGGGGAGGGGGFAVNATAYVRKSGGGQTVMTFRAKKSDAEAFAQDKLDLEAFRKKVSIQTYLRKTDSPSAARNTFNFPVSP